MPNLDVTMPLASVLPIHDVREDVLKTLTQGNTLILQAPTGSGKSTQVPQFLLDHLDLPGEILVLQPRRIAARMLADRIAWERGVACGEEIGFQTRFERSVSPRTKVRFITEGILPRMMMSSPDLSSVSAVIFDEFHERSITVDLGLGCARHLQSTTRPDLKIIVMSATLETGPIKEYLPRAGIVSAQGRIYPIQMRYAPGAEAQPPWEKASQAVCSLIREGVDGDILVFMPGAYEIRKTVASLERIRPGESIRILSLHGEMAAEAQQKVLLEQDKRRVIVATNIAETSLTIPGVRHVMDCGLARISRYDPARGFTTLYIEPISRESADQRAGRAGREGPGICVRLWSERSHTGRAWRTPAEIHRIDLAETVLALSMIGFRDPLGFPWFEPPAEVIVKTACDLLENLGARGEESGTLTPVGIQMAGLPVHPRLARLIIEATNRGVPRLGAFAAATLSERWPLSGRPEVEGKGPGSDFLALHEVMDRARERGYDESVCARLKLQASAARRIDRTHAYFLQILRRKKMLYRDTSTDPARALGQSLLLAYPDHLARRRDQGTLMCDLRDGRKGELSASSSVRQAPILVAAEIREIRNADKSIRVSLSLASEVTIEWLRELFPQSWFSASRLEWDAGRKAVVQRNTTTCLGVVLEDYSTTPGDLEAAGSLLAETITSRNLPINGFNEDAQRFISRVQWVRNLFPEQNLPQFSQEERLLLIHELCSGETSYTRVKEKPLLPVIRTLLSGNQMRFVDEVAPESLPLPSGKRLRITYAPGQPPRARARIQELFGLALSPRVAKGREPVRIEILAPNMRPVQITEDLNSFWTVQYPELKKTLSRRYPRHEWR